MVLAHAGLNPAKAAVSYKGGAFTAPGIDARMAAMGGTGVVSSSGTSALFWNPANLYLVKTLDVQLGYSDLYGLGVAQHNYAGAAFKHVRTEHTLVGTEVVAGEQKGERFAAGLLVSNLGFDMGSYSYGELIATAGFSCLPNENVLFGMAMSFLRADADLDDYSSSGIAAHVGVTVLTIDRARVGLVWKNFYSSVNWKGKPEEKLPFLPSAGISYDLLRSLTVTSSVVFSTDGGTTREEAMGMEWYPMQESVALRAGLRHKELGEDSRWVGSFGAGIGIGRFVVDYAYVLDNEALGSTHVVSGTYRY